MTDAYVRCALLWLRQRGLQIRIGVQTTQTDSQNNTAARIVAIYELQGGQTLLGKIAATTLQFGCSRRGTRGLPKSNKDTQKRTSGAVGGPDRSLSLSFLAGLSLFLSIPVCETL